MSIETDGFRSPFKDCVTPKGSTAERGNAGSMPDGATKTGESMPPVVPKELPINELHMGTPDKNRSSY